MHFKSSKLAQLACIWEVPKLNLSQGTAVLCEPFIASSPFRWMLSMAIVITCGLKYTVLFSFMLH